MAELEAGNFFDPEALCVYEALCGPAGMTTLRITLQAVRFKLAVWRYLSRRETLRLMLRVLDWMEPGG